MVVVGRGRGGGHDTIVADVSQVGREQGIEGHIVTDHADDRGDIIVERYEYRLIAIRPWCGKVFQRDIIKIHVVHRDERCRGRITRQGWVDRIFHLLQYRVGRRHTGKAIMDALGLFPITSMCRHRHAEGD